MGTVPLELLLSLPRSEMGGVFEHKNPDLLFETRLNEKFIETTLGERTSRLGLKRQTAHPSGVFVAVRL